MKKKDAKKVLAVAREEGMLYAFEYYSGFEEIDDDRFHQLRQDFLDANKELRKYLETESGELLHQEE